MRRSKSLTTIKILDAAYGLMWRQGFLRVSMVEIAERAGVTNAPSINIFPAKMTC
jgi:AcrR family transcriptional regulator